MVESFSAAHEKALFERYLPCIKCPKCNTEDVFVEIEGGYFRVNCKKCSYRG